MWKKPVVKTDNGPQFISNIFELSCQKAGIYQERIPNKTPNKNTHIEPFHKILEYRCHRLYEFGNYAQANQGGNILIRDYNKVRILSSLKYRNQRNFIF